jgi:hypothetical protein
MQVSILYQCLHRYRHVRNFVFFTFDLSHAEWRKG